MLLRLLLMLLIVLPVQALAERRVALVLAAEEYRNLRALSNPVHDALAVEDLLKGLGFEVTVETDRDLRRMRRALEDFKEDGAGADVALVFYAGHGVEIAGLNYLLPVDAEAGTAQAVADSALPLSEVQAALSAVAPVGIVLLDACREDPWGAGGTGQGRSAVALADAVEAPKPGLGRIGRADGVLFAFSAAPGEVAADGDGQDSPFTEALLRHFATPGVEVRTALTLVQQDVYDRSRGKQLPYIESGLPKLFFAAEKADLGERDLLLVAMAGLSPELRAEVEALAQQKDMPLAPLYGALMSADLAGKDKGARQQALAESAESFLKFRAQVQQLSADDPKVAELRVRAEAALDLGSFDLARKTLGEAVDVDAGARDALKDNYRARTLSEAQTHALAAQAARADLRYDLAVSDLNRAIALYAEIDGPDLPQADRMAYTDLLWDQGDLFRLIGNSDLALRAYRSWAAIASVRVLQDEGNGEYLRNWSVARTNVGDMLLAQGDLDGAEAEFKAALEIDRDTANRKNAPLKWRHDLFVSQSKLGDVAQLRGDLAGALALQEAGRDVLRALVREFPDRDDVKGDMATALERIGDLRRFSGDLTGAMAAYDEGLAIRQALADKTPDSREWQQSLAISMDKIGDILMLQGDPAAALQRYSQEKALIEALAAKDSGNAGLQSNLAMGFAKIGDAKFALQAFPEAIAAFQRSLSIRQGLLQLDPSNGDWQREVNISQTRLGDVFFKQMDFPTARVWFELALQTSRSRAEADSGNAERQQDLSASLDRVGDVAMMQGDDGTAKRMVVESYDISKAMAARDPANVEYQTNMVTSLIRVSLHVPDGLARLQEAKDILLRLQQEGRLDPAKVSWIALIDQQIAALK